MGSINESVIEGTTGYLVSPGDETAMSERWLKVLNDSQLADQLGVAGRQHVISNSSLSSMTEGYMELVESVFRGKGADFLPVSQSTPAPFPAVNTGGTDSQTPVA